MVIPNGITFGYTKWLYHMVIPNGITVMKANK